MAMWQTKSGMSNLAKEAGFGTRVWSYYGYLAAKYFHFIMAGFIVVILLLATFPYLRGWFGVPLGFYVLYFSIRKLLPKRFEPWFYRSIIQFARAQLGMVGLFVLIWLMPSPDYLPLFWVLFLPILMIISRHCSTSFYFFSVVEGCLMIIIPMWWGRPLAGIFNENFLVAELELTISCVSLTFTSFIIHYLMRNIDARHDILTSFDAIKSLLDRDSPGRSPSQHWRNALEVYLKVVNGICGAIWLCDQNTRRIRPLTDYRYCIDEDCPIYPQQCDLNSIKLTADHPIAEVARSGRPIYCLSSQSRRGESITQKGKLISFCELPKGVFSRILMPIVDLRADRKQTVGVLGIDFERPITKR